MGIVGPLVDGLIGFRTATYIRALQSTVYSIVGGRGGRRDLKMSDAYPELSGFILGGRPVGSESLLQENVINLMDRMIHKAEEAKRKENECTDTEN